MEYYLTHPLTASGNAFRDQMILSRCVRGSIAVANMAKSCKIVANSPSLFAAVAGSKQTTCSELAFIIG